MFLDLTKKQFTNQWIEYGRQSFTVAVHTPKTPVLHKNFHPMSNFYSRAILPVTGLSSMRDRQKDDKRHGDGSEPRHAGQCMKETEPRKNPLEVFKIFFEGFWQF